MVCPVVRVGRNALHFADPAAYADIYSSPEKLPKDPELYRTFQFGLPSNIFTVTSHKQHAIFRSMLGSFFSKQTILKLEDVIQERIDKLISQLVKNHKETPVGMHFAFRSATFDIITIYSYRTTLDMTSYPSFRHPILLDISSRRTTLWLYKHFPFLVKFVRNFPRWLSGSLVPSSKAQLGVPTEVAKLVDEALQRSSQAPISEDESDMNVFYSVIRNAGTKNQQYVTREYLISEGVDLRIAGSDTVGNACSVGARHLVRDDRVRKKLVAELDEAWPDRDSHMPLERLEKLPYLVCSFSSSSPHRTKTHKVSKTAVIKECLRLSHGVVSPMQRVVTDTEVIIAGHRVPPGTIVSMANPFVHLNPDIFPEPERFYPERWLEVKDHTLERYLVSFGKGPRTCLGINLAWSELYMIIGNVFRKLELKTDMDLGLKAAFRRQEVRFKEAFVPEFDGSVLDATVVERLT
ncbi:hypothetical protein VNI00_005395 [Paramarasmius palmivorus]|uniref:Cytochrome P450 n=1 Tax=Paramarasmius palmivorus TaxID=297713 RepID=A0AAW0DF82_9AGAR